MVRGSWPRYVALGDSLTAGRDDLGPEGTRIGWARRLAGMLGERTGVPCTLANLARDGASVEAVLAWQLPSLEPATAVEAWRPDLVSVTVGMNDIRDPEFEPGRFATAVGTLLDGLAGTGATVLTCTLPDMAGMLPLPVGLVEVARQRLRQASDAIREEAGRRDAICLDLWTMTGAADPGLFGADRIHPNTRGHQLIADAFAALLFSGTPGDGTVTLLLMSTDLRVAAGRQWVTAVVFGVLGLELAAIVVFAATYDALDFRIYMWGGHAMLGDGQLYLTQAYGHWFTYSPFAALVYAPGAVLPLAVARVLWDLLSVAALAWSCVQVLRLAGYRPSRTVVAGLVAAAIALEPVWETLFLGQINLILLALVLTDMRRLAGGRVADSNTVGIGIGVAAAIKLTPAIFIVFLLLARRTRAAMVAAATFVACGLTGCFVAPDASRLYWRHLFFDTHRVGAPYISNQSPYATAIRIASGQGHIGGWWIAVPVAFAAIGLATAAILARRHDWLAATAVTGTTGLLVSPISWAHHWVWAIPVLVLLFRSGHRVAATAGYLLFAAAPFWFTPHAGGPREYGFHWLVTLAANCFLAAGLAFGGFMAWQAWKTTRWRPEPEPLEREGVTAGAGTG